MDEVWKDVIGFEGEYMISNHGRLKHYTKKNGFRVLKNTDKSGWYLTVNLNRSGKRVITTRIHVLVAQYFIENPLGLKEVNHIDGNKQNNYVDNLEWCTRSQNVKHAISLNPNILSGLRPITEWMKANGKCRQYSEVCQYSLNEILINTFLNATMASKETGVCHRNILQVASKDEYKPGKTRKQAGGFIWRYLHEN